MAMERMLTETAQTAMELTLTETERMVQIVMERMLTETELTEPTEPMAMVLTRMVMALIMPEKCRNNLKLQVFLYL